MPKKPTENITRFVRRKIMEIAKGDSIIKKWEDTTYGDIQRITNPKKGVLGEMLVAHWMEESGYPSEGHGYERTQDGDNYDLLVMINDKLRKIEVKLATQDTNDKYQFNWIAVDRDISLIVFLGVDPDSLHLAAKTRKELMGYIKNPERGRTLTPVPKGSTTITHVKWTASKESAEMAEIKTLDDIKAIFDAAAKKI